MKLSPLGNSFCLMLPDLLDATHSPMPHHVKPMLATLVKKPFDREGWIFEIKWDGWRALSEVNQGVRLYSRNDKDLTSLFRPVVQDLTTLPFAALFDGEIVVVDKTGRSDFQLLQRYVHTEEGNIVYYVFDILWLEGYDLRALPLIRRKSILKEVLPGMPHVKFTDYIERQGIAFFASAVEHSLEGIVGKNGQSIYRSGRSTEWIKVKSESTQDVVIGGFTLPEERKKGMGWLLLGVFEGGRLVYVGNTSFGITPVEAAGLRERLQSLVTADTSFDPPPRIAGAVWVRPLLVCEVRYLEWTDDGYLRHPVFERLREDKDPHSVDREDYTPDVPLEVKAPNHTGVRFTNLLKVFFPTDGYTKGDVIDYYRQMASLLLPYIKDHPQTLHRHPNGIRGKGFFHNDVDQTVPEWVRTVEAYSESEGRMIRYLVCDDEDTLLFLANLGCIEINPHHTTVTHPTNPDYLVLDLDPLDIPFSEVVRAALAAKDVLDAIGAASFCKTSGKTGLHVYVPLGAKYSQDQSVEFARLICLFMNSRLPETTSLERLPDKRRGKVYLDFLQNQRGRTLAAPYCLCPRDGAPVSTPLRWEEVNEDLDPCRYTMRTIRARIDRVGDLWEGIRGPGIDMESCLKRLGGLAQSGTG